METKSFLKKVYTASSPVELSEILQQYNKECFKEYNWDIVAVKAFYRSLLDDIEDARKRCQIVLNFKTREPFEWDNEKHEAWNYDAKQAIRNLDIVQEFIMNPPVLENPKEVDIKVDVSAIDWSKPVYTPQEVKTLLNISDNTLRKWAEDKRWITFTKVDGSKVFYTRESIIEFLNRFGYPAKKPDEN